jgi:hypothetical protein
MDSAIAAAKLDWPVDKLRVLIIDDSASHELQRRAESYANSRALHLTYHRRVTRPGAAMGATAKSALINFGLTETRLHGRTAADFCLVLDADVRPLALVQSAPPEPSQCIADPDMLRAMIPYMLQDQQLGLVRSSQVFYNVPSPMSSTLATFINAVEPSECVSSTTSATILLNIHAQCCALRLPDAPLRRRRRRRLPDQFVYRRWPALGAPRRQGLPHPLRPRDPPARSRPRFVGVAPSPRHLAQ